MNNNDNEPHRVIYKPLTGGRMTTRVFPNKIKAEDFAKDYPAAQIQLASESPTMPPGNKMTGRFGDRDLCACKRTKLKSDSCCAACGGSIFRKG